MSRLLTVDTGLTPEGDAVFARPKLAGGGSSKTGKVEAAGRRAVSGCEAGLRSSAGPILGGGTAIAAMSMTCGRLKPELDRRYSGWMLGGVGVVADAMVSERFTTGLSAVGAKDQNRPPKLAEGSRGTDL